MADERKGSVTIPQWLIAGIIPVLITVGGWVWTASALTSKVNAQENTNEVLFRKVTEASDLAKKHDTVIPIVQTDIAEIKSDIRQILRAVKQ